MGEWRVLSLREAGVSLIDCEHRTPPASDSGYPYIAIPQIKQGRIDLTDVRRITRQHFIEWTRKANPETYDVILSRRCNPGETAYVPPGLECALGQNLVLLRADGAKVFPPFLRWLVRSTEWWEQVGQFINVGAVFDSLKCADIPNFRLPIPPLPKQCAIASLLGTLDDKIDLNHRMNKTLETMARAIFKDWFVDFGPTRAKAEGRAPYLVPDLWSLFPNILDDEDKPIGWCIKTLGSEFNLTMGQSPPGETYNNNGNGLPFFQGRTDFGFRYPNRRMFCTAPTRIAEFDDTLVSVRAPVGDLNLAWEKCCIGRGIAAIRHKSGSRSFTYYTLMALQDELRAYEHTGTVFGAINKQQFEALEFICPGQVMIRAFEDVASPFDERIRVNTSEIETLTQLRDLLLPKLMSGEIRLKDAEKAVEALA
jgi:type I restriction enzyme, S subunit